jgi:hypothetical protein
MNKNSRQGSESHKSATDRFAEQLSAILLVLKRA